MSLPSHSVISETTPTFYVGRRQQVGYGFGSVFRSLYRAVVPLFQSEILPRASNFASDIAKDVLAGHNLQSALRAQTAKHGELALTDIVKSFRRNPRTSSVSTQTGSGLRRTMPFRPITNDTTYPLAPIIVEDTSHPVRRTQRRRNPGVRRKRKVATGGRRRRAATQPRRTKRRTTKPRRRTRAVDSLTNI